MSAEITVHTEVVRQGSRPVAIRRRCLRIVVRRGPDKGKSSDHADDRIVLGTHPACQVVLGDPTVSRQHCEIALVPRGYLIRDLDSTNGVVFDGVRVGEITIDREVTLQLGDTQVALKPIDASVELPLATATRFGPLLGHSVAMRQVFDRLARLAPSELAVLITGESGTGKELAAQAIHEASPRRHGPLRIVDCGAIAHGLIESELFGHVKGAFTGADRTREGAFVAASGGTLFLDEIGELPLELQARLLGALERRVVVPVGSSTPVRVDVRILAATHRDLRRAVNVGTFREDLYFRIAGATVVMPPLRERPEDIPLYVDDYFEGEAQLDAPMLAQLQAQRWPGNVRELRNALARAAVLGAHDAAADVAVAPAAPTTSFPVRVDPGVPYKLAKAQLLEEFDRHYLDGVLAHHDRNITHAAHAAGLDRVHFLRMLDRLGLRPRR